MSGPRRFALVVGVVLVLGGLAVVVVPGLAAELGPSSALVTLVGVLALLAGVAGVRNGLAADADRADLPEPERRTATTVPGADIDTKLGSLSMRTQYIRAGHTLRRRIRSVAMDVLTGEGYTEAEAATALDEGTWTDDPYAAMFFTDRGADLPLSARVRDAFGRESSVQKQTRHAIDALAGRLDATGRAEASEPRGTRESSETAGTDGPDEAGGTSAGTEGTDDRTNRGAWP